MPNYEMALTITVKAESYDEAETRTEELAAVLDEDAPEFGFWSPAYILDNRGWRIVLLPPVEAGLSPTAYRICNPAWRPASDRRDRVRPLWRPARR